MTWLASSADKYGGALTRDTPADPSAGHLAAVAGPGPGDQAHPLLSVRSPLLWLVVLGAATAGLATYSTTAKVGPVAASVKVG